MALAKEVVIDTFVPKVSGFENTVLDPTLAPFQMTTSAGSAQIAGRARTIPSLTFNYAPGKDTYDDVILNTLSLGVGDGTLTHFTASLATGDPPIVFNTTQITDGVSLITDQSSDLLDASDVNFSASYTGFGSLRGDGTGTINYTNGSLDVTFNLAPAAGVYIFVTWLNMRRTPVDVGAVAPTPHPTSLRLQKIRTDSTTITEVKKLALKPWDRLRHVTGRREQSRERNEDVSIQEEKHSALGNSIFDEGDIQTGCQLAVTGQVVDPVTNTNKIGVSITAGAIWIAGAIRHTPTADLLIDGVGEESIGLRVIWSDITEDQDSALRNPATGWKGSGTPGAYRQRVEVQWRANDASATTVYRLFDGVPLLQNQATVFSDINRVLARRTYNTSGNYKVWGFRGSIRDRYDEETDVLDDNNMTLDVDAGVAYVQGFEIYRPTAQRLAWRKAIDTGGVIDGFQYKPVSAPTSEVYTLTNQPVAKVMSVRSLARTPKMRITRGVSLTDVLPNISVEYSSPQRPGDIYSNIPNTTAEARVHLYSTDIPADSAAPTWVEGEDFDLDSSGDGITWRTVGVSPAAPAAGATYYGYWNYDTDNGKYPLVKGTRVYTETDVAVTRVGTGVATVSIIVGDVYNVISVTVGGIVYTTGFTFTTGRTLYSSFGPADITFSAGVIPAGAAVVRVAHWSHNYDLYDSTTIDHGAAAAGEGDFVSADSYLEESATGSITFPSNPGVFYRIPWEKINNSARPSDDLVRDNIDFRPEGVGHSKLIGGRKLALNGVGSTSNLDSTVGNGIGTSNVAYEFFLPRLDAVTLDQDGRLSIIYGAAAVVPRRPVLSDAVLRLLEISSEPNSRTPKVGLATVTRTTMAELQIMKSRLEEFEVEVATAALEQDAQNSAQTFQIRGIYTDPFVNFDFMDLHYSINTPVLQPGGAGDYWVTGTSYVVGKEIRDTNGSPTLYARCVQTGTSGASTPFPSPTTIPVGTILTDASATPVRWLVYAKAGTTEHVFHDVAVDSLAGSIKFPTILTEPKDELKNIVDVGQTSLYIGNQMVLLPFVHKLEINQPHATETELVNPYSQFEPVMNVTIEPAADFWIDTKHAPDQVIQLPGSTSTNVSLGYTGSHQGEGTTGSGNPDPVHPLPATYPIGHIDGWDGRFHVGRPVDILSLGITVGPGVVTSVTPEGHQAVTVTAGGGDPDFWGFGFVPQEIRMSERSSTQRIGDVVVDTGLVLYTRSRPVRASGNLFPTLTDISCKFAGRTVALAPVSGKPGKVGTATGTVQTESNPSSNDFGKFIADFTIPSGIPLGNHEVKFTASGKDRSVTYIAHGQYQTIASQYTSVTTTTYDVIGSLCPVAQSFIPDRNGYVSKIVLYFYSKDTTKGVEVQVRNMVNGYPGQVVLGKVAVQPASINISPNATATTEVIFTDPVYVTKGTEYCFAILDDSDQYRVFIARLGQNDVNGGGAVNAQPNIGAFFKSANNTTWTADQYVDMKYQLYFADFTAETGVIVFEQIPELIASQLMLYATQFLPTGSQINWEVSLDEKSFFPIAPAVKIKVSEVFRKVDLRATFRAAVDSPTGPITAAPGVDTGQTQAAGSPPLHAYRISPALNIQHVGISGEVYTGEPALTDEFSGKLECNYISENTPLSNGFAEIKTVIESFRPTSTSVIQYFSTNDGATWLRLPNAAAEDVAGVQSFSDTLFGGNVYESVRSMTFNPLTVPAVPTFTANSGTGGSLTNGVYYVRYAFACAYGIGDVSTSTAVTVSGGDGVHSKITFPLPTGTSFPTHTQYNVDAPVNITGVKVYMTALSGASGTELELAPTTGYTVASLLAGGLVTIISYVPATPSTSPPTVNTSIPLQFRTRTRLIAPHTGGYMIPNPPPGAIPVAGNITIGPEGGSFGAGTYSVVYAFVADRIDDTIGVTAKSASHGASDITIGGGATNTINVAVSAINFDVAPRATGVRFYVSTYAGIPEHWVLDVEVVRDNVVTHVDTVLPTDVGVGSPPAYRILNLPAGPVTAPTTNTTGAVTATAPQVAKYRVIVHDEAL